MKKGYSPMMYVHIIVTLFLMFGFGFIPPFATLTPMGMRLLGAFLGVIYGYSTCEIIWPSLFAFIAYGLSGFPASMNAGISATMGSPTVFQIITQYFTAGAIVIYGFGKWFIRWSLSQKAFKGKPLFYTWCFMFTFMWSAIVLSQIAMALLLYAIWTDIAGSCGYDKDSSFRYYGFGGILLSMVMGGGMIPYKSWMLGLATTWADVTGEIVNLGFMFLLTGLVGTIVITAYVILGARLFKVDFSIMKGFDVEKMGEDSRHLRPRAKRIIIVYVVIMLLSIFAGTFTKNPVSSFVNNTLTVGGLYCLCSAILMVLPSGEGDGKAAIVFNDIKHSDAAVSWPVIMMCAITIPLATAMTNEATGILPWLTGIFEPLFAGRGPLFILIFTIIVMMILTNVGSNIAFGGAMIPVVSPFVMAAGMNPVIAGAALIWIANIGIVLPGASAPASIFHGRSEIPDAGMRTKIVCFGALLILIIPGNLGSFIFRKVFKEMGVTADVTLTEKEGNFCPCRLSAPAEVTVGLPLNLKGKVSSLPASDTERVLKALEGVVEYTANANVFEGVVNAGNVINHIASTVLSTPEIDRKGNQFSLFKYAFTPSVVRCIRKISEERKKVIEAMGMTVHGTPTGMIDKVLNLENHPEVHVFYEYMDGPNAVDHRYLHEDCGCGGAFVLSAAGRLGLDMPVLRSFLGVAGAINDRDYINGGRTLENLGFSPDMPMEEIYKEL